MNHGVLTLMQYFCIKNITYLLVVRIRTSELIFLVKKYNSKAIIPGLILIIVQDYVFRDFS